MSDHSNPLPPQVKRVPDKELRRRFNEGNIWEKTKIGELQKVVLGIHIPDSSSEPPGTVSQMLSLRSASNFEIARVHIYLRPDGNIGGSGKPDPKIIYDQKEHVLYMQERKPKQNP